jgi:hypothetical protein
MNRRFQFSLARLFSAIGLLALALWLLRVALDSPESAVAAIAAFPVVLGSAIGSLFGRGGVAAITVVVIYCFLGWMLLAALTVMAFIQG